MTFSIDDKVRRKGQRFAQPGEVVGLSKEMDYPGVGPSRKVYWNCGALGTVWDWDFELEVW